MNDHERNLFDLYAGLAMVGWIINGDYSERAIPQMAFDTAKEMMKLRTERVSEHDQETPATPGGPVAVPDVEGRPDSAPEGIAALKKPKARITPV